MRLPLFSLLLLLSTFLSAQTTISELGFKVMYVLDRRDTVFFAITEKDNFDEKKGLVLFMQGSRPVPLFPKMQGQIAPPLPFNYWEYAKDYRFVVISKRGVPVMPDTLLQPPMYLDPLTKAFPKKYEQNNHLSNYVETANLVLTYLLQQKWVDKKHVCVMGHSEGARIATKLTAINPNVRQLVFLSCSAFGRAYNFTSDLRKKRVSPTIQNQYAKQTMIEVEEELKNGTKAFPYDFLTYNPLDDLVKMDIPILVMFGTEDTQTPVETNDLIYIEFMKRNKRNLTMYPLEGLDHNFFRPVFDSQGVEKSKDFEWDKVGKRCMDWLVRLK